MAKIKMLKSTANHKLAKTATVIIKRGRKPLTEDEKEPSMRFKRVAGMRLAKITKLLKGLRACANTAAYIYTDAQVDFIFESINKTLRITEKHFREPVENGIRKIAKLDNPLM